MLSDINGSAKPLVRDFSSSTEGTGSVKGGRFLPSQVRGARVQLRDELRDACGTHHQAAPVSMSSDVQGGGVGREFASFHALGIR